MPAGGSISFDLKSIKDADKAIEKLVKNAESGIAKVNKAWKDMTKDGLNHYIDRLRVAQNAMSKLSNAKINIRISGQANDIKRLGTSASNALIHVNKLITAMQQLSRLNVNIVGSGGASATAMDAQKIKYLEDQIKLLEKQLDVQQKIGKAIGAQVNTTNNVTNSMNGLEGAARRLRQLTSTIFSVQALMGFGNKLLQIRGEFEMQHRSLQVLLQDVDKANELWDKTVALAVKSPFRVKDLVTYTKQLAAYRVESDKLYDTTRMLADVSSGLGVDMNRLILAFGQVKAANFLRGTELRQFSEAGVNMLEELSKRFTQLEGRAVSVGDVFERVSKRMVSFKDVEAVFQTITSEGGTFYQMQEKQSETLKGMIMNLKDSLDLMFNEVGISQDSALKAAIRLVKELVDNWRNLVPILKSVGIAFAVALPIKGLLNFTKGMVILVKRMREVGIAMSMLKSANVWAVLIGAVSGLITYIVAAKNKVDELTASMGQIDREATKNLEDAIVLYRKLSETIKDVTTKESERSKALSQLQSRFNEILPSQMLELEYIKGISDNYADATDALMNYYNAKAVQQKKDKIESQFGEGIDKESIDLIDATRKRISELKELGKITERQEVAILAGVERSVNLAVAKIKSGEIDNSFSALYHEIFKGLEDYSGVDNLEFISRNVEVSSKSMSHNITQLVAKLHDYKEAISGVIDLNTRYANFEEEQAASLFLPEKEGMEEATKLFKQMLNEFSELSKKPLGEWGGIDTEFQKDLDKLPDTAKSYETLLRHMFERLKEEAANDTYDFSASLQGLQQEFKNGIPGILFGNLNDQLYSLELVDGKQVMKVKDELLQHVNNTVNAINREVQELNLTPFQESLIEAMRVIADETGVSVEKFTDFIPQMGETVSTARQEVAAKISLLKDDIEKWEISLKAKPKTLAELRDRVLGTTQTRIDEAKSELEAYKQLLLFLGEEDKDKNKDTTVEQRIKVVDQMNAKYKELNKTLSHGESLKGAFEAYKDAFATAYEREDVRTMTPAQFAKNVLNFPNEDDVIKWLENLAKEVKDEKDKFKVEMAQGKFEMDVRVRVKKDADKELKNEIEEMFDQYDLFLDLKKLQIPTDVAKGLFNIDTTSIEQLRESLVSRKDEFVGKDMLKEYEDYLKKLDDMEDKAQMDRLKKYLEYTRAAIGERAKIKVEELNKLMEIEETFKPKELKQEHDIEKARTEGKTAEEIKALEKENEEIRKGNEEIKKRNALLAEQKPLAIAGVKEEAQQKEYKQDWEDFKTSDTFINIFNDLDNASSKLIQHAIDQIDKFKSEWTDMPIESAKEMALKLNELQLALLDTDRPLKDNKKLWAELGKEMESRNIEGKPRNAKAQAKLTQEVTKENKGYEEEIALANKRIEVLQTINNINAENKAQELEKIGYTKEYVEKLGLSASVLTDNVEANNELIKGEKKNIKDTNDKVAANRKVLNIQKQISKNSQELNNAIGTSKKLANDLYNSFKELTEVLGGDGPAMIFADMGMSMANTVLDTVMLIVQMNAATIAAEGLGAAMKSASGIIGWIVMAVELLVQAITAAFNYADKVRQMKLDVLAGQVDNLKKKYDALAESVEKAYSIKQMQEYEKELDKLHKKMVKAQDDYIKLLEAGDKNDKIGVAKQAQSLLDNGYDVEDLTKKQQKALLSEEYQNYKDATEDLAEMQKDYEDQKREMLESLGAVSDPRDATSDFVDAWVDAYKETGDGLQGLKDNFTEFFDDIIKQQASMKMTEKFMQPFYDNLDAYLDDYEITKDEMDKLRAQAENIAPELSKALEELWTLLGGSTGEAMGGLSALEKGIQGITEDQADVLAAYWNAVRMSTASIDSKMDLILANMGTSADTENPMIIQLRAQTDYLKRIHDLFDPIIKRGAIITRLES